MTIGVPVNEEVAAADSVMLLDVLMLAIVAPVGIPEPKTFCPTVRQLVLIEMLSSVVFECVLPVNSITTSVLAFQYSPASPDSHLIGCRYMWPSFNSRARQVPLSGAPLYCTGAAGMV